MRYNTPPLGKKYFNIDLGYAVWWNGAELVNNTGAPETCIINKVLDFITSNTSISNYFAENTITNNIAHLFVGSAWNAISVTNYINGILQYSLKFKIMLVCKLCGSKNVEIKSWVDANTNICNVGTYLDDIEDSDTYCNDCETHSGLILKNE